MTELVGPGEAARRLGVTPRTVQRWLRSGRLPAVRVGDRLKVPVSALAAGGRSPERPVRRLLVANRGELVARIARTCTRLDIDCLALVPADQAGAWWTTTVHEQVPLEGDYLDASAVIDAARRSNADAIHPGYGFLAENPAFAGEVAAAGLVWIGPRPDAMKALGDKATARRLAARVGVPVLPGYDGDAQDDATLEAEAARVGYPVLLKPSAGGGGKGMHVVRTAADLREALGRARREARAAFGDERLVLERYLDRPRHVEVQILADAHGNVLHLGERDCSVQRRHQKVIEEAPAPGIGTELRVSLAAAAVRLAREASYEGAGTAEFLVADDGTYAFLELNARLQVEHPVTEAVTRLDLVEHQLRIAAGERLAMRQGDVRITGHAIEARLYAEDPWAGFLPASGTLLDAEWPAGEGVRVDRGVGSGDVVSTRYDPLLGKIIASGSDRESARRRLVAALAATRLFGVTTNRGFLMAALEWPELLAGDAWTDLVDARWHPDPTIPDAAWDSAAAALHAHLASRDPRAGFRLNAPPAVRVRIGDEDRAAHVTAQADHPWRADNEASTSVALDVDGRAVRARLAPAPTVESAVRHATAAESGAATVQAPMPGVVLAVRVREGERVEAGQPVVVLEAMKMENAVPAPVSGTVHRVLVRAGGAVQRGDALVELG